MNQGHQMKELNKWTLRCKIMLDLIVLDSWVALVSPFVTAQFINRRVLKTPAVFFLHFCLAIVQSIAGLFHFGDHRRIIPVNRLPRPSGSFIQGVFRSLALQYVVNSLKTFLSGLVASARGLPDTLVMVRTG